MALESRLTMVTLGVEDIVQSTAFYENLGFVQSSASRENRVTFFITHGTVLCLFGRAALAQDAGVQNEQPSFRGVALAHNLNSEKAVDQALEHAVACGARATQAPHKTFWGGYSAYFADPDGHLWELAYNPFSPLDENGNMPLPA